MKNYSVLITGGEKPNYNIIKAVIEKAKLIVCADSGYDYAKQNNVVPEIVIGDMDSVKSDYSEVKNQIHPVDKDFSDTNLALKFLSESKEDAIYIIGGGGGRLDHLLSNINDFKVFDKIEKWWTKNEIIYKVEKNRKLILKIQPNSLISIMPLSSTAKISTKGLKWNLDDCVLNQKKHSLSNLSINKNIEVQCFKGSVLVIIPYQQVN